MLVEIKQICVGVPDAALPCCLAASSDLSHPEPYPLLAFLAG